MYLRNQEPILITTPRGVYCPQGDFYIDPHKPVDRAVVTHGHADHAYRNMGHYLCHPLTALVLRTRLGKGLSIQEVPFGDPITINGANVCLYPAGHVLGSAQVRIEVNGNVAVMSGDYKRGADPQAGQFEPLPCNMFVTESTFALPVYQWPPVETVIEELLQWWSSNAMQGITSVLVCYSLGKAQRLMHYLVPERTQTIGTVYHHDTAATLNNTFRAYGIHLPEAIPTSMFSMAHKGTALIIAPGSFLRSPLAAQLAPTAAAMASGWMAVRNHNTSERGFVLSDHCSFEELVDTVTDTGADHVVVHHGFVQEFCSYLQAINVHAQPLAHMQ
jgi:putative mRNA 3-end processing factor